MLVGGSIQKRCDTAFYSTSVLQVCEQIPQFKSYVEKGGNFLSWNRESALGGKPNSDIVTDEVDHDVDGSDGVDDVDDVDGRRRQSRENI